MWRLYNALRRQNVPTKMVVYPRQPHGFTEPKMTKDAMERSLRVVRSVDSRRQTTYIVGSRKAEIKRRLHSPSTQQGGPCGRQKGGELMGSSIDSRRARQSILALTLVLAMPVTSTLDAQTTFAILTGTVTDPSGAVLPGVTVTATNTATQTVRTTVTAG